MPERFQRPVWAIDTDPVIYSLDLNEEGARVAREMQDLYGTMRGNQGVNPFISDDFDDLDEEIEEVDQEDDVQEAPELVSPERWCPRRGLLAQIHIPTGSVVRNMRHGEVMIVNDYYGDGMNCGWSECLSCDQVDLLSVRPNQVNSTSTDRWVLGYQSVSSHLLRPLRPEAGQEVTVRCELISSTHHGSHLHTTGCINPIRSVDFHSNRMVDEVASLNETLFADQLAQLDAARVEQAARIDAVRPGHEYLIDSPGSSLNGFTVEITGPINDNGEFPCRMNYPDRTLYRNLSYISGYLLGQRIHSWSRSNMRPNFLQFANPTYAVVPTRVSDREVVESADDHECDHACFNYGCTQGPAVGWTGDDDSDYDSDNSPEDYIDDIPIMPYSYVPQLIFSGEGPVYLGMELELSCGNDYDASHKKRQAIRTLLGSSMRDRVYLKNDSSIEGAGFEAVFHPMTYDWAAENWPVDLLRRMRADGAMPHSSCGMHVHVSRSGFSDPVHAFKWIKFIYRNASHISRMARRDPTRWGSFRANAERAAAKWHAKGGHGGGERYVAINCIPRDTYEVRIFAPTLNRTRLLGSLGLVDASVEYTRQVTTEQILKGNGWGFDPFCEYVHSFKKYRPLQTEMARLLGR